MTSPGGSTRDGNPAPAWQEVIGLLPDGVLVVDEDGLIVFVSPQLGRLTGYPADELVGQPVHLLMPKAARARPSVFAADSPWDATIRVPDTDGALALLRRDGSTLSVALALAPVTVDDRRMILALIRDLTGRLESVAERERLLETLELNPDAVVVVDLATMRIEYVNEATTALLGRTREELVGAPPSLLIPDLDRELRREMAGQLTRDGTTQSIKVDVHTRDGTPVPVEVRLRLVATSDGSRHVLSVARDLRSRKVRADLFRISEEAFRAAFEHAPIGVCVAEVLPDGSRSIRMANQALADMLGTTVDEIKGHTLNEFTTEEDPALALMFQELVAGRRSEITTLTRFRRSDSITVWAEKHARMFALPGGHRPPGAGPRRRRHRLHRPAVPPHPHRPAAGQHLEGGHRRPRRGAHPGTAAPDRRRGRVDIAR